MIKEYEVRPIDEDDLIEREKLLSTHKYSVIFDGNFLEYDTMLDWLKQEGFGETQNIFYGKLSYDYGFFEFFFPNETTASKFSNVIPTIFTEYPVGSVMRSDSYDNYISQKDLDNNKE
jgi:hypothetical protein